MTQTDKRDKTKKYRVMRGIENGTGSRINPGVVLSYEELLKIFPEDTLKSWILRKILQEAHDGQPG
jgi:hypothetical protein